jgi:hypothetical protein
MMGISIVVIWMVSIMIVVAIMAVATRVMVVMMTMMIMTAKVVLIIAIYVAFDQAASISRMDVSDGFIISEERRPSIMPI